MTTTTEFLDRNGKPLRVNDRALYGSPEEHTGRVFTILHVDSENSAFWYTSEDEPELPKYSLQTAYHNRLVKLTD
ncbi:MAG: hypothetical protein CL911_05905 [Deltaproteobacteria bacterium]|jgi:hypothetical protein|nr:hypothetical protein [Deltaproteobacteria bacterium]